MEYTVLRRPFRCCFSRIRSLCWRRGRISLRLPTKSSEPLWPSTVSLALSPHNEVPFPPSQLCRLLCPPPPCPRVLQRQLCLGQVRQEQQGAPTAFDQAKENDFGRRRRPRRPQETTRRHKRGWWQKEAHCDGLVQSRLF